MKNSLMYGTNDAWAWLAQSVLIRAVQDYNKASRIIKEYERGKDIPFIKLLNAYIMRTDCLNFFKSSYGEMFFWEIDPKEFIKRMDKLGKKKIIVEKEKVW